MLWLIVLILALSGCSPWRYVGPDLSANTYGPVILTKPTLYRVCQQPALGCAVCTKTQCAIYVLEGMSEARTREIIKHEWKHAKGWVHGT